MSARRVNVCEADHYNVVRIDKRFLGKPCESTRSEPSGGNRVLSHILSWRLIVEVGTLAR